MTYKTSEAGLLSWLQSVLTVPSLKTSNLELIQKRRWSSVFKLTVNGLGSFAVKVGGPNLRNEITAYRILGAGQLEVAPRTVGVFESNSDCWLCLEWIEGSTFAELLSLDCIVRIAKAFGQFQNQIMPDVEFLSSHYQLPNRSPQRWPSIFASLVDYLTKHQIQAFQDYVKYMPPNSVPLSKNFLEQLNLMREEIVVYSSLMENLPITLDHGDLHAMNFGLQPDGSVFILDWSHACWSIPFVSLEFLMRVAQNTFDYEAALSVLEAYLLGLLSSGSLGNLVAPEALEIILGLAPLNFADAMLLREIESPITKGSLAWVIARSLNQILIFFNRYERSGWDFCVS